tara:strand:+ start:1107 stop:1526 length:420 start_codon:yes stop_codon:yes gene_type:complete
MKNLNPFHLAIPVDNLKVCKDFYEKTLECSPGRFSKKWADYNFFGHQLVLHFDPSKKNPHHNKVDGKSVPVPHFGIVLSSNEFIIFEKKLKKKKIKFEIEPYDRFKGLAGEQRTMFFYDPSGNALEFKSFKNINQLFKK